MNSEKIDLAVAQAAVRAAGPAGTIEVSMSGGKVSHWHTSAAAELLRDAQRIYWDEPPPGLDGFDLACEIGDVKYRFEVTAPAPGGRR